MATDTGQIATLLDKLLSGEIAREEVLRELSTPRTVYACVEDFARIDLDRAQRTGVPEFIYSPGKTVEQIVAIAESMMRAGLENILATRMDADTFMRLAAHFPEAVYHPLSRLAVINPSTGKVLIGRIGIVTAGTSDLPVAEEAEIACAILGSRTERIADIGVACLSRTLDAVPLIDSMNVVLCIAGMEATLPSVLGGLVSVPIIAVPTSVGYGVNAGGLNALLSVLGSCAPGILAVNIDNGIGAAAAAHRINTLVERGAR